MAYDEGVAQRLREAMNDIPNVIEKKMFGGLAFMVQGHMCCGVVGDELMLRVGADGYEGVILPRKNGHKVTHIFCTYFFHTQPDFGNRA